MKTKKEILKEIRDLCNELKRFESKSLEFQPLSTIIMLLLEKEENKTKEIIDEITGTNQRKKYKPYV